METNIAFDALAGALIDEEITYLWRGYGSAIFIEIGELTPRSNRDGSPGHPEGQISLGVEWSWRIEDNTSILCGSWSEEELWEPSFARLRGARIKGCRLFGRLPEIELSAENGIHFVSFSTTDGQPQWHLVDRRAGPDCWFTVREGKLHLGDGSEPAL
jgi:hypothetical protein